MKTLLDIGGIIPKKRKDAGKYQCAACRKCYGRPIVTQPSKMKICPHCGYVHCGGNIVKNNS